MKLYINSSGYLDILNQKIKEFEKCNDNHFFSIAMGLKIARDILINGDKQMVFETKEFLKKYITIKRDGGSYQILFMGEENLTGRQITKILFPELFELPPEGIFHNGTYAVYSIKRENKLYQIGFKYDSFDIYFEPLSLIRNIIQTRIYQLHNWIDSLPKEEEIEFEV